MARCHLTFCDEAESHPCRVGVLLEQFLDWCCEEVLARSAVGTRNQPRSVPPLKRKVCGRVGSWQDAGTRYRRPARERTNASAMPIAVEFSFERGSASLN